MLIIMCHIFLQHMSLIIMIQICNLGKLTFSRTVLLNVCCFIQHSSYFYSNSLTPFFHFRLLFFFFFYYSALCCLLCAFISVILFWDFFQLNFLTFSYLICLMHNLVIQSLIFRKTCCCSVYPLVTTFLSLLFLFVAFLLCGIDLS